MQKNSPVRLHKSAAVFSEFCADMGILPSYTPIFLTDVSGRIVHKQKLSTAKEDFESIYSLVEEREIPFMLEQGIACDAYVVKGRAEDGKSYIAVSKDRDGFSRCVVCSYSEQRCIRLHDYIQKLCSYKDYLDSFSALAFSSVANLPAKRLFRMKISGALELVSLASNYSGGNEKTISFPVSLALEKLCAFASKMNGSRLILFNSGVDTQLTAKAPESFFKLAVSVMALAARHSADGRVYAAARRSADENSAQICFTAKSCGKKQDIYEKELAIALRQRGLDCGAFDDGNEYSFFINVPIERKKPLVISDVEGLSLLLDEIMGESVLSDMYCLVSDI